MHVFFHICNWPTLMCFYFYHIWFLPSPSFLSSGRFKLIERRRNTLTYVYYSGFGLFFYHYWDLYKHTPHTHTDTHIFAKVGLFYEAEEKKCYIVFYFCSSFLFRLCISHTHCRGTLQINETQHWIEHDTAAAPAATAL